MSVLQLEPLELPDPALCCGSNVPLNPYNAQATGAFQRVAVAGSVKVRERTFTSAGIHFCFPKCILLKSHNL